MMNDVDDNLGTNIQSKKKMPTLVICYIFISQHMTTKIKLRPNNLIHSKAVTQWINYREIKDTDKITQP